MRLFVCFFNLMVDIIFNYVLGLSHSNAFYVPLGVEDCNAISTILSLMYVIIAMLIISCILALAGSIVGCASVCCSVSLYKFLVILSVLWSIQLNVHVHRQLVNYNLNPEQLLMALVIITNFKFNT